ncbi:MAG: DUF1428 domain-containing protein [Burkholderiales bacterium]|jgi:uncharacterized protein YbaA (DUF1428 family)|nr:DUF1428 domain-containing protein [Burkholderiales bacterium]
MPRYVDGYLLPVPKKNIAAYARIARKAGKIWMEHGALEYRECVGEDLHLKGMLPFPGAVQAKPGETVFFSWIVYRSRKHRDSVNAKVMQDPRLKMDVNSMPFDFTRMFSGGFEMVVDL